MRLTPREVYDAIMAPIEPELTSGSIPLLKEKYKDETPEQKKARGKRYMQAYAEYDKRYAEFEFALKEKSRQFAINAIRDVEAQSRVDESAHLDSIESTLSSLD